MEKVKKIIGSSFSLGALLLSVITLVLYAAYFGTNSEILFVPWVVVFLVLAIVGEAASLLFHNDYLAIAVTVFPMFALGCFLMTPLATLWSVASHFNGVTMEGSNAENFGLIIGIAVLCIAAAAFTIAACFFKKAKVKISLD